MKKPESFREILAELRYTDPLSNMSYKERSDKMIDNTISQMCSLVEGLKDKCSEWDYLEALHDVIRLIKGE